MEIKERTIGSAWKKCCAKVMQEGKDFNDGEQKIKEITNLLVKIASPQKKDKIIEKKADSKMITWMMQNFFEKNPIEGWGYSYGQRLFEYNGIDQIESIIAKIKKKPETKAATITLMNPGNDERHAPCVCLLDFKKRNRQINLTAVFRSQDIGKKMYADAICLGRIMQEVSDRTESKPGELILHIISAHVYEADFEKAIELAGEKL